MKSAKTPRSAASSAVIALREALGVTQQSFASNILKMAISTVSRWETKDPPHGESLLQLAEVARAHNSDLAGDFYELYLDELRLRLPFDFLRARATTTQPYRGFLVLKLTGHEEMEAAEDFVNKMHHKRLRQSAKSGASKK